jgi:electron transfer flavoprotein alpha subunit/electron transfer flavoprotein alpha/beta subunit
MVLTQQALRIAVLVKQIPLVEEMRLGDDGRIIRAGAALEVSAFCRRAVSKAVELAASRPGSSVVVFTLGPPAADDALREAVAWGLQRGVDIRGVLVTDPAFAGSDTIATAGALAAALRHEGSFDLALTGRNSLDADTGQVPPQLAELLDLPFAAGAKELLLTGDVLSLGCEHDDSWLELEVRLPAVVSCAERLCDPAKVPPERRAEVPAGLLTWLSADDLGPGPWGADGSLTTVGACREMAVGRLRRRSPEAPLATQVKETVRFLLDREALGEETAAPQPAPVPPTGGSGPVVAVIAEPGDDTLVRELCGLAARLAAAAGGSTVLVAPDDIPAEQAGSWGADLIVRVSGWAVDEDIARAVAAWAAPVQPWGILVGSTAYGREIASRVAVALGAGLTGDAVGIDVADGKFVAWKPAFGGQLVAAITATTPVQMATIRAGVIPLAAPRAHIAEVARVRVEPRRRIVVRTRRREDALEGLGGAEVVIGVGKGVAHEEIGQLEELRKLLGAEVGCTRRVTDVGEMPHARQIGITGRSIAPRLYIAIGTSGKFNHMAGVRAAGTVVAINPDPDAPVWQFSDLGMVGRWQDCVPLLTAALREALARD